MKLPKIDSNTKSFDKPLKRVYDLVDTVITNPANTARIYNSSELDEYCQKIGEINLTRIKPAQRSPADFVYIVTRLQKSGGHTRVLQDFIQSRPGAKHVILSTQICGPSDVEYVKKTFCEKLDAHYEVAPRKNFHHRLQWLQNRILELNPKKVFLFNHHQDSIAIAAVQPQLDCKFSFYHHGDHHLCLGASLKNIEHIDFNQFGFYNCREQFGIDNIYIPLTSEDRGNRQAGSFLQRRGILTCTVARSNKIEIKYPISYFEVIPELLAKTGGQHIHIGKLTPWGLFKLRRNLKKQGVSVSQFKYIPWVPSVWEAVQQHGVDLYIVSFPYSGALTLIEVMGAGIPVAMHRHLYAPSLDSIGMAYEGAFTWQKPEELINFCTSVSADELLHQGISARTQYERYHRPGLMLSRKASPHRPEKQDLSRSNKIIKRENQVRSWLMPIIFRLVRRARARFY